ncbi:MAG: hypothetical protein EPO26_16735 [Chloroflexota bacterium]|nr:MAG: hypothetical protein EPO26_16735 [Chloroflexota bacterium]
MDVLTALVSAVGIVGVALFLLLLGFIFMLVIVGSFTAVFAEVMDWWRERRPAAGFDRLSARPSRGSPRDNYLAQSGTGSAIPEPNGATAGRPSA